MIAIPNMEKPKNCSECILADKHLNGLYEAKYYCRLEADNCPLIEIVVCGECKWWDRDGDRPFGYCHAEKHCHFSNNWEISIYRTYKADHFCFYGERRADEHNTERD